MLTRLPDFYFSGSLPPSEIINPFCAQNVKKCDVDFSFYFTEKKSFATFYNYEFSVLSIFQLLDKYRFFAAEKFNPLSSAELLIKTYGKQHYLLKVIFSS